MPAGGGRPGRVSLSGFYIRRAFRILPLYYLVLAAYVVLVYSGVIDEPGHFSREQFSENLPYYLTYLNELVDVGHYHHSWSLGVEEKFYLVWPLLAFVLLWRARRWRLPAALALLVLLAALGQLQIGYDVKVYEPILMGCILGLVLHDQRLFELIARWSGTVVLLLSVVLFVAVHLLQEELPHGGLLYAAVATGVLALALLHPASLLGRSLAWGRLRFLAERSYAVYLIHVLGIWLASAAFGEDHAEHLPVPLAVLRFVLALVICNAVAELLWRGYERPLIRKGKKISQARQAKLQAETS